MEGVSWWSWQHAGKRQWKAVGKRVAPLSSSLIYDSYPTLRPGSKGDLVAWAQQLLAGGGYSTPITGYFESPTRTAVSSLQSQRGLPATGSIDSATWRRDAGVRGASGALDQGRRGCGGRLRRGAARAALGLSPSQALRDPAERPPPLASLGA